MKKLKKERFKFNREYIKPMTGGLVLFVLIVILLIVFGYNPTQEGKKEEGKDKYSLDLNDKTIEGISCDADIVKSIKNDISNMSVKVDITEVEGEKVEDAESSTPENPVYYTRKYTAYNVVFGGISNNLKVLVTNDINTDEQTITKDNNSFVTKSVGVLVKYTVKVYSNNENCKDVLVREFEFTTPVYNVFSDLTLCENNTSSACEKLVYSSSDISKISKDYEIKTIEEVNENNKEKKTNYVLIICVGVGLVLLVGLVIYIVYRNRRKRMVI